MGLALISSLCGFAYWIGSREGRSREPTESGPTAAAIRQIPLTNLNPAAEASGTFLRHDFGLVRPNEQARHGFVIRNTGNVTWNIKCFHTSCACTVTQASAPFVDPGGSVVVEVAYRAPASNKDEKHRVVVEFEETGVPFVFLEVAARIREAVCCFPDKLEIPRLGRGQSIERSFEIHNHSEQDFQLATLVPSAPWLTVSPELLAQSHEPLEPRQRWRIAVRVAPGILNPGKHRGSISISTDSSREIKVVPVELVVSSPLEAIPGQFFLGSVVSGQSTHHKVLLRFTPECLPAASSDIILRHDLGSDLLLRCEKRGHDSYDLIADYTPGTLGFVEGKIIVRVQQSGVPSLEVPFFARVKAS